MAVRFLSAGAWLLYLGSFAGCGAAAAAIEDGGRDGLDGSSHDAGSIAADAGVPRDATDLDDTGLASADASIPPEAITVRFGPIEDVPRGEENTQCVIVRLGNVEQLRIGAIHNVLGPSSHHFIVYRTQDTEERREPFECSPFVDTLDPEAGAPLMITQRSEETLRLPEGVAFTLEPDQMVRLEMHYVNYSGGPIDIEASATFIPIAPADFRYEADFLFIGNIDVDLPPRSPSTLGPTYFALPSEFSDANFFGITGHTHRLGTNVRVSTAPGPDGPASPVYDISGWSWSEPETAYHDPPFHVPAGGGFQFTCDYDNVTDERVRFGESASREMCFFWAYYYPSRGARVCAHTDQYGSLDVCCPGSGLCSLLFPD